MKYRKETLSMSSMTLSLVSCQDKTIEKYHFGKLPKLERTQHR